MRLSAMAFCCLFGCRGMLIAEEPTRQFTNSIGMKFVWLPAGSFVMGSTNREKGRGDDETPHQVKFSKGLYFGTHLVTQEQWKAIMGNNHGVWRKHVQTASFPALFKDCGNHYSKNFWSSFRPTVAR